MKVMCSNSMRGVMEALLPGFERTSGSGVEITYDPAKLTLRRIRGGESADAAIIGSGAIDELSSENVIDPDTRVVLARSSIGMAVVAGAVKPDIGSVDAFKAALLKAKSIAYTIDGASGMHFSELIGKLGIAEAVTAKARRQPGGLVGELVARGEAEVAIQQISELMAVRGIDLAGPIPQALQKTTVISGGVFRSARTPEAARALLDYLRSGAARAVIQAKGLDAPAP